MMAANMLEQVVEVQLHLVQEVQGLLLVVVVQVEALLFKMVH